MSITIDGNSIPAAIYKKPMYPTYDAPFSVQRWRGVRGAAVLLGDTTTRMITVDMTATGYSTEALLNTAMNGMDALLRSGTNGSLVVGGVTFPNCYFVGYEPREPRFEDGTGVNGWTEHGTLKFLQIDATT